MPREVGICRGLEISEEIKMWGVGISREVRYALRCKKNCYEALYVHKSGVYGRENVNSSNILLIDKKICSKYLFGIRFSQNFCPTTKKQGGPNKSRGVGKISKY